MGARPHSSCLVVCSHSLLVGDGGGSCHLVPWHRCSVSLWLCLLVGLVRCVGMRGRSSSCTVGHSCLWTVVVDTCRWRWGSGSHLSTVVVVGASWGLGWLVMWCCHVRSWVTSMVVVGGVVAQPYYKGIDYAVGFVPTSSEFWRVNMFKG